MTKLSKSLRTIAWGWVILHLHFNLGTLELLPNWLGYVLLLNGMLGITPYVPTTSLLFSFGMGLAGISLLDWILTLFGVTFSPLWLTLPVTVVSLYFRYQLLSDIASIPAAVAVGSGDDMDADLVEATVTNESGTEEAAAGDIDRSISVVCTDPTLAPALRRWNLANTVLFTVLMLLIYMGFSGKAFTWVMVVLLCANLLCTVVIARTLFALSHVVTEPDTTFGCGYVSDTEEL